MKLSSFYLNRMLDHIEAKNCEIEITDSENIIVASTNQDCIGIKSYAASYVSQIRKPVTIESKTSTDGDNISTVGFPILLEDDDIVHGCVIVEGPLSYATELCKILSFSISSLLEHDRLSKQETLPPMRDFLSSQLLSPTYNKDQIKEIMAYCDINPNLLSSVIVIEVATQETTYFSIDLNLGYQSSQAHVIDNLINTIKKEKYLTSQDLIFSSNYKHIAIIKTFLPSSNLLKVYKALNVICEDFDSLLSTVANIKYTISFGNVYNKIDDIFKSYQEALELLSLSKENHYPSRIVKAENLIFPLLASSLHPQILNEKVIPILQELRKENSLIDRVMLNCCEVFIDNNLNLTEASKQSYWHRNTIRSKIDKFYEITKLDPRRNFTDAVLIKLICTYEKLFYDAKEDVKKNEK